MFAEQRSTSGSSTKMQKVTYFCNYICAKYHHPFKFTQWKMFLPPHLPQLLHHQILLRATGRDEASLNRMAFANLGLIHHLRVALVFIYAESCLLLLVVSNLLLCRVWSLHPSVQAYLASARCPFKTCLAQQPWWLTTTIGSPGKYSSEFVEYCCFCISIKEPL